MTNFPFYCLDCKVKFSMESEYTDINKATKEVPARCPKCMKVWGERDARIESRLDVPSMETDIETKRKRNAQATRDAQLQAQDYARRMPREEMVRVQDPDGRRGDEYVPKELVETIKKDIEQFNS